MELWVRNNFTVDTFHDEDYFLVSEGAWANLEIFLSMFGAADPTLESLQAADPNNETGWHRFFNEWQAQGLLS